MGNERQAFEDWAKLAGFSIKRGRMFEDIYDQVSVNKMWEAWQAGVFWQKKYGDK